MSVWGSLGSMKFLSDSFSGVFSRSVCSSIGRMKSDDFFTRRSGESGAFWAGSAGRSCERLLESRVAARVWAGGSSDLDCALELWRKVGSALLVLRLEASRAKVLPSAA